MPKASLELKWQHLKRQARATKAPCTFGLLSLLMLVLCLSPSCTKEAVEESARMPTSVDEEDKSQSAQKDLSTSTRKDAGESLNKDAGKNAPLTDFKGATGIPSSCEKLKFPLSIDIAEASGATLVRGDQILVVGDSGTKGAALWLRTSDGKTMKKDRLPLDSKSSDDLEGISYAHGKLFGIVSSGWMREWTLSGYKATLVRESYALSPKGSALQCDSPFDSNCAENYEGLCMRKAKPRDGECVGFAAAKASGMLRCLVRGEDDRLQIDAKRSIKVSAPRTLSGCDFDAQDRLWVGHNLFAASRVEIVKSWQDPSIAKTIVVGRLGLGFPEALALDKSGQLYRFSDTTRSPSLLNKYKCSYD